MVKLIITDKMKKCNTFTFKNKCVTIDEYFWKRTPIAQWIEHCPPEAGAAVRVRLGVFGGEFIKFMNSLFLRLKRKFEIERKV